jgi:hypothetical protein
MVAITSTSSRRDFQSKLIPTKTPFNGVVKGKLVKPLGHIVLTVMFGQKPNYQREMLHFKVVDFTIPFHMIFWIPDICKVHG